MPDKKTRVLITGFGPYHGVSDNISEATLDAFRRSDFFQRLPADVEIITEILSVDVKNLQTYGNLIKKHKPSYVIALGHSEELDQPKIRYEAAAFNCYVDLSNYQNIKNLEDMRKQVEPNAPKVQFGVNSNMVFDLLKKDNALFQYSYHSDFAMCNSLYYELIHEMEKAGKPNRTIFLHLEAPKKNGPPETFDAIGFKGIFNTYADSYAHALEKTVTTLNTLYQSATPLKGIGLTDQQFQNTFIPSTNVAAKKSFDIMIKETPQK